MELIIIAVVISFYMAVNIGANDGANSMADAVGAGAIGISSALILGALFELLGAVLVGSHVSETVRKGIIDTSAFSSDPERLAYGMMCALLASAVWLHLSSLFGLPVSTTHSIVGSIFGFGLVFGGLGQVNWAKMGQIVASWLISPIAGGLMAYLIFRLITRHILATDNPISAAKRGVPICVFAAFSTVILATIFKGLKNLHLDLTGGQAILYSILGGLFFAAISVILVSRIDRGKEDRTLEQKLAFVERLFVPIVIVTSCSVAFAHGANDVANAVGPLAAVVEILQTQEIPKKVAVDMWILFLGGAGIAVGLVVFGRRVISTVGTKITPLTPTRGVAADIGAMVTVLTCSKMGLPISTTHTLVGAILGVGIARGISSVDIKLTMKIFTSWITTVPFTGALTVLLFLLVEWLLK